MRTALWIVGEPGVGKTSLARKLMKLPGIKIERPKWTIAENVCAAGHYTGKDFDGADTVPYNGVVAALMYWTVNLKDKDLTIFDGDRFSYEKAVEAIRPLAERVCCILLYGNESKIRERRKLRSEQDEVWVKGRKTKAVNFFLSFEDRAYINADYGEEIVFQEAIDFLSEAPRAETVTAKQSALFQGE